MLSFLLRQTNGSLFCSHCFLTMVIDVTRQNGVADFRDALNGNNNAYATDGNVIRQNGIMNLSAEDASGVITPELIRSLETLLGGENLTHFLSSTDAEVVKAISILSNSLLSLNVLNGGDDSISIVELLDRLQEIIKRDNDKTMPKGDNTAYSDLLNLLENMQFDSDKGNRRRYLRGIGGEK